VSLIGILAGVGLGSLLFGLWLLWRHTRFGPLSILLLASLSFSLSAADRTSVVRHPNGTSGAITSISVTVLFYEYDASGGVLQRLRCQWTESPTTGALVGNRMLSVAAYPLGNWGTAQNVTSNWSSNYVPKFNASAAVEDPNNFSGWNSTPAPLLGASWFTPPNDTLDYIWSSGYRGPEEPPAGDWNPQPAAGQYWPIVAPYGLSGNGVLRDPTWPAASVGTIPVHCRGVRAFIRVSNDSFNRRFVSLVWDEVVNDEAANRFICTFILNRDGSPWVMGSSGALMQRDYEGGYSTQPGFYPIAFCVRPVYYSAGNYGVSQNPAVVGSISGTWAGRAGSYYESNRYQAVISRFLSAYHRDNGGSDDVVAQAFQNDSALVYIPAAPTGAKTFAYETGAMNQYSTIGSYYGGPPYTAAGTEAGVPLFDRCGDPGSGTGTGGGTGTPGTGTGWGGPTDKGIPAGAGTKTPALSDLPAFGETFGLAIGSWASFSPTAQEPITVNFNIPWVDGTTQTFTFTSVPSDDTPMGAALNDLRMLVRSALAVFIVWTFLSRIYRDLVMY